MKIIFSCTIFNKDQKQHYKIDHKRKSTYFPFETFNINAFEFSNILKYITKHEKIKSEKINSNSFKRGTSNKIFFNTVIIRRVA